MKQKDNGKLSLSLVKVDQETMNGNSRIFQLIGVNKKIKFMPLEIVFLLKSIMESKLVYSTEKIEAS